MATPHPQVEFHPEARCSSSFPPPLHITLQTDIARGEGNAGVGGKGQRGSQSSQFSALSHHFFLPVMWEENPEPLCIWYDSVVVWHPE